jgi:hypothetical protein
MSRGTKLSLAAGVAAAVAAAGWLGLGLLDGPWGMIPGGAFRGEGRPCGEAPWERLASVREVELEVRPSRPRSITTWNVVRGNELYVPADFLTPWKRWPHQVVADGSVRVRVGGDIFECHAERVLDPERIAELRLAAMAKYDLDPGGRAARTEVWWFRLGPH